MSASYSVMFPFGLPDVDAPLVPSTENWPVFDSVLVCSLADSSPSSSSSSSPSTNSDPLPSSASLAEMKVPPSRGSPRKKNPDHIPRPRNAFMLFRSAFAAAQKIGANVERDNRHITRIIAHCWNRLSDAEKQVWRDKAAAEKAQHAARYPNYRFNPIGRTSKPVKRNVRRNGAEDVKRCEKLAELVMAGKHGQELESAVKMIDQECRRDFDASASPRKETTPVEEEPPKAEFGDVPPFRSPLLPPTNIPEPQISYSPIDANSALTTLWDHQYYQPDEVPYLGSFQPFMDFTQDQSVPDFTHFSWNQSDSFPYYH